MKTARQLRSLVRQQAALLREIRATLATGGDFQLGEKGRHRDLVERIDMILSEGN